MSEDLVVRQGDQSRIGDDGQHAQSAAERADDDQAAVVLAWG
jgi:hypothetical protein